MISVMRVSSAGSRLYRVGVVAAFAALVAVTLPIAGCDEILTVEDPDIIDPNDVQSAAGANALRIGALARLNAATSGSESLFLLGGLFADEWKSGDTFIDRQQVDQRAMTPRNTFLATAGRTLHRARLSAEQAIELLARFSPDAPGWQVAEMHWIQAYTVNLAAEHYCSGLIFSTVVDGVEMYGTPITTQAAFERALGHADDGLGLIAGTTANDLRVRRALQVTRGRILLNLDRPADAEAAVAGVPTGFRYLMLHSEQTRTNSIWNWNNTARRYTVSDVEGGNGMNFVTANDPRVPVCTGGDAVCRAVAVTNSRVEDTSGTLYAQLLWPERDSSVAILDGIGARMIEAEAQLRAGDVATAFATLNAARATVPGLAELADPGSDQARVDLLFRERAFWFFGRGQRVGDLRRLIRQYGRQANIVFPTGAWHKGGAYGGDVTIPLPLEEANNPNVGSESRLCLDRNA
jgi:starch-binding outer membrane protein, SusD/RagB family